MLQRMLVVGASGRLGRYLCDDLRSHGRHVVALSRADMDITDAASVGRVVGLYAPDVIINCSAYNAVDAAEVEAAQAFAVNAAAVGLLARAADHAGALFVHYGSDFVFDGRSCEPYHEDDVANPLSAYGASKLAGEIEVRRIHRHYILRVASLFGGSGVHGHRSTIDAILDQIVAGTPVRALVDRTVSPSHVGDVARVTRLLIDSDAAHGTYHCVSSGQATWYDLAQHLAASVGVPARIEPVTAAGFKTPARRPQFCALSNAKLRAVGIDIADWQSVVTDHVRARSVQAVASLEGTRGR